VADRRSRRELAAAALFGAAFAVLVILVSSRGDVDRMTFGDGRLHRAVAMDLNADDPEIQSAIGGSGPALRYGRIALPATLWLLSGGSNEAMRYVQPAIMVLCAAAIAMAGRALLPGRTLVSSLAPFLAVGLSLAVAGGFAEPLAVALALVAVWLIQRERYWPAAAALTFAMLARENAAAVLIGVSAWEFFHGRRRGAAVLWLSAVPVVAWHLVVAERFGHLPLRDPWLVDTGALATPVVAVARSLTDVSAGAVLMICVHIVLVVLAVRLWRTSILGAAAAASALPILSVGSFTWRYVGDAARLAAFLEVFVVLALLRVASERTAVLPSGRDHPPVSRKAGHARSR
jgi:hypothetical protein